MKQFGFSKAVRLKTPQEYAYVFEHPIRITSDFFTVLVRPNGWQQARLGVIVAKRYAKKATVRNRIRRLIRESFRHHQALLVGLDVVVLLRKVLSTPIPGKQLKRFESPRQFEQIDGVLRKQWQRVISSWKKSS